MIWHRYMDVRLAIASDEKQETAVEFASVIREEREGFPQLLQRENCS